jgi:hypothetical protein
MKMNRTTLIKEGLLQLPGMTAARAEEKTANLRKAEEDMLQAAERVDREVTVLAAGLVSQGDWTEDEVWMTDLRGDRDIMRVIRSLGDGPGKKEQKK